MQDILPPFRSYGNLPRGRRQIKFYRYLHTARHMPGCILKVQCLCHRTLLRGYGVGVLIFFAQCIGNRITVCGNHHVSVVPSFRCLTIIKDDSRGIHVRNGKAVHFDLRGIIILSHGNICINMVSTRLFCLCQQIAAIVFFVFYSDRANTSQVIHRHGRRFGLSGIEQVSRRRISQITGRHIRFTDRIFFRYCPGIVPLAGDGDGMLSGVSEVPGIGNRIIHPFD